MEWNAKHVLTVRADDVAGIRRAICRRYRPDAIVCANDAVAIRLMQTLSFLGKRVPEDIAVVGCDGIDSSRLSVPSLTTIHQPVEQIAEQAFMTLMSRIRNTTGGNPREILLDAPLVARSSTIGSNSCARKIRIRKGIITS
jgi:LacI family transcriptional regulator